MTYHELLLQETCLDLQVRESQFQSPKPGFEFWAKNLLQHQWCQHCPEVSLMIWYKSTVLAWDVECHAKNHPVPWCSSHVWFIDSTNWWPLEDSEDIIYADIMVKISYDMEHYTYCHNHSELLSYQVCYHIIIVLRHIAIYIAKIMFIPPSKPTGRPRNR